ncbi:MAG: helix-turn-helix domain-containing protein [Pirellulaceae bacterium]
MTRATTVARRRAQRARVILLAFAGTLNVAIAIEVGLSRKHVGRWRRRWKQSFGDLGRGRPKGTNRVLSG